jgi:hypothetical protein
VEFNFDWNYESSGVPYVTINETSISFNQRSIEMLQSAPRIEIGFDKENLALGFRPLQDADGSRGRVFVGQGREKKWFRISCKDFVKSLAQTADMPFKPAVRLIPQLDDASGVLFVQLKPEVKPVKKIEPLAKNESAELQEQEIREFDTDNISPTQREGDL